jgi:hypothetical protein
MRVAHNDLRESTFDIDQTGGIASVMGGTDVENHFFHICTSAFNDPIAATMLEYIVEYLHGDSF